MSSSDHSNVLPGQWIYATDPRGDVGTEPLYDQSLMSFTAEGGYSFRLGQATFALEGSYVPVEWSDAGGVLNTDYGRGRTNQLHIALHRDGDDVLGYVVREGENKINPRYYRRLSD